MGTLKERLTRGRIFWGGGRKQTSALVVSEDDLRVESRIDAFVLSHHVKGRVFSRAPLLIRNRYVHTQYFTYKQARKNTVVDVGPSVHVGR